MDDIDRLKSGEPTADVANVIREGIGYWSSDLDPDVPYDAIAADVLRVIVEQPTNRENNRGITGNV